AQVLYPPPPRGAGQPLVGSAGARGGEERRAREQRGRGGGSLEKRPAIDRLGHRYCLLGVESAGMVTRGRRKSMPRRVCACPPPMRQEQDGTGQPYRPVKDRH